MQQRLITASSYQPITADARIYFSSTASMHGERARRSHFIAVIRLFTTLGRQRARASAFSKRAIPLKPARRDKAGARRGRQAMTASMYTRAPRERT